MPRRRHGAASRRTRISGEMERLPYPRRRVVRRGRTLPGGGSRGPHAWARGSRMRVAPSKDAVLTLRAWQTRGALHHVVATNWFVPGHLRCPQTNLLLGQLVTTSDPFSSIHRARTLALRGGRRGLILVAK